MRMTKVDVIDLPSVGTEMSLDEPMEADEGSPTRVSQSREGVVSPHRHGNLVAEVEGRRQSPAPRVPDPGRQPVPVSKEGTPHHAPDRMDFEVVELATEFGELQLKLRAGVVIAKNIADLATGIPRNQSAKPATGSLGSLLRASESAPTEVEDITAEHEPRGPIGSRKDLGRHRFTDRSTCEEVKIGNKVGRLIHRKLLARQRRNRGATRAGQNSTAGRPIGILSAEAPILTIWRYTPKTPDA